MSFLSFTIKLRRFDQMLNCPGLRGEMHTKSISTSGISKRDPSLFSFKHQNIVEKTVFLPLTVNRGGGASRKLLSRKHLKEKLQQEKPNLNGSVILCQQ